MRSDWVEGDIMGHILSALMEPNRLAIETSMHTGLRIGDVLNLKLKDVLKQRFSVTEQKTKKRRNVFINATLQRRLINQSGMIYVFENRLDSRKARTRQAVYKDIKRATKLFRISAIVTPHSARKFYAVDKYHTFGLKRTQKLLNHSNEAVTLIYALADELTKRSKKNG